MRNILLSEANRALELLNKFPYNCAFWTVLLVKGRIRHELGQMAMAVATFRQLDDTYAEADRKMLLKADDVKNWRYSIVHMGSIYLAMNQSEAAKRCFLRVLEWPRAWQTDRVNALHGLARYHKERKDWTKTIECSAKALQIFPHVKKGILIDEMDKRLLLLLADAAEGQGDLKRAREFDMETLKVWYGQGGTSLNIEFVDCYRRQALEQLAAGLPHEAAMSLKSILRLHVCLFQEAGIHFEQLEHLKSLIAALKVLVEAMMLMEREVEVEKEIEAPWDEATIRQWREKLYFPPSRSGRTWRRQKPSSLGIGREFWRRRGGSFRSDGSLQRLRQRWKR